MMINKIIKITENIIHSIIVLLVLVLCGVELKEMIFNGTVEIQNIILLFIYMEVMTMVGIFFTSGKIPIRYPLYISMFALSRHISFENLQGIDAIYLAGSILLIALSLLGLAYRDRISNHDAPELK